LAFYAKGFVYFNKLGIYTFKFTLQHCLAAFGRPAHLQDCSTQSAWPEGYWPFLTSPKSGGSKIVASISLRLIFSLAWSRLLTSLSTLKVLLLLSCSSYFLEKSLLL
jgi:hypothetical protein